MKTNDKTKVLKWAEELIDDKANGLLMVIKVTEEDEDSYNAQGSVAVRNMSKAQMLEQLIDKLELTKQDLLIAALAAD